MRFRHSRGSSRVGRGRTDLGVSGERLGRRNFFQWKRRQFGPENGRIEHRRKWFAMRDRRLYGQRDAVATARTGKVRPVGNQQFAHVEPDRLTRPIDRVADAIGDVDRPRRQRARRGQFGTVKLLVMARHNRVGVHGSRQLGEIVCAAGNHGIRIHRPARSALVDQRISTGSIFRSWFECRYPRAQRIFGLWGEHKIETEGDQEGRNRIGNRAPVLASPASPGRRRIHHYGPQVDDRRLSQLKSTPPKREVMNENLQQFQR